MALCMSSTILYLFTLLRLVVAQFGPDDRWINPDGSRVDFSSTFTAGDTIVLSWKALNQSRADLWVTHWNQTLYPWHNQIATNIDISVANSYKWNVNTPTDTIQSDNHFVLRFFPRNASYGILQFSQFASPGFLLIPGPNTTSSTQTSATATSTMAVSSSTTSSSSTATASPASSSSNSLSVGAQAGIGVGVGLIVIALFVAGCFFGRRYGRDRVSRRNQDSAEGDNLPMALKTGRPDAAEADGTERKYHDGPQPLKTAEDASLLSKDGKKGMPVQEMDGNSLHPIEKSSAMVRPGVHELG